MLHTYPPPGLPRLRFHLIIHTGLATFLYMDITSRETQLHEIHLYKCVLPKQHNHLDTGQKLAFFLTQHNIITNYMIEITSGFFFRISTLHRNRKKTRPHFICLFLSAADSTTVAAAYFWGHFYFFISLQIPNKQSEQCERQSKI